MSSDLDKFEGSFKSMEPQGGEKRKEDRDLYAKPPSLSITEEEIPEPGSNKRYAHKFEWLGHVRTKTQYRKKCECATPHLFMSYDIGTKYTGCYAVLGWACNVPSCQRASFVEIDRYELPKFPTRMSQVVGSHEQRILGPGDEAREGERVFENFTLDLMAAKEWENSIDGRGTEIEEAHGSRPSKSTPRYSIRTVANYVRGLHGLFSSRVDIQSLREKYGPELELHAVFTYPAVWELNPSTLERFKEAVMVSKVHQELSTYRFLCEAKAAANAISDMFFAEGLETYDNHPIDRNKEVPYVLVLDCGALRVNGHEIPVRACQCRGWSLFDPIVREAGNPHPRLGGGLWKALDADAYPGCLDHGQDFRAAAASAIDVAKNVNHHSKKGSTRIEGIVLTGGLSKSDDFCEAIRKNMAIMFPCAKLLRPSRSSSHDAAWNAVARGAAIAHAKYRPLTAMRHHYDDRIIERNYALED